MNTVSIQINAKQIETAIEQLNDKEKFKIAQDIITAQFKNILTKFRATIKNKKLDYKKINNIVEKARDEFYVKSCDRR